MKRRKQKDSYARIEKKTQEKATTFHDRLVLKFLNKLVEVNYEEGNETADEFEKLTHQWNFYCVKFQLKDAKEVFPTTIKNILDRIRANRVTQILTKSEIDLKEMGLAASIRPMNEIAIPYR